MITLRRILVPTDYSATSEVAVRYAVELSKAFNASLHVLHVLDPKEPFESDLAFPLGLDGEAEHQARKRLSASLSEETAKTLSSPQFELRGGSAVSEIVRYAKERDIDLIVMGTHSRGVGAHGFIGSVAEKVVRTAPCPVVAVHHPEREFIMPAAVEEQRSHAAH